MCSCCEKIFNSVMQLEHHKEMHGHWSDDEYDTGTEDSDEDENGNMTEAVYEEETVFGPDVEKSILLCSQF